MNIRSSAAYKIAVNYAAVLAWATLVLGATVFLAINADFNRQRDRGIVSELARLSREPDRAELLRELRWRQDDGSTGGLEYALFNNHGKKVAGTLDVEMPEGIGLRDFPYTGSDRKHAFIRGSSVDTAAGDRLVVSMGTKSKNGMDGAILKYFAVAFAILFFLSAIGGAVTAHYLRQRLRPISTTANAIVSGDFNVRVPLGGRGDEFDAAGQAFNLMLDRIAGLMENLRQVSSDIAHDLRKPLIRLLNQADRLGQEGAEDRVLEIGDEMLALFTGILRIAEVEGGRLERSFAEVDLSALMTEIAESFAPALVDAGNSLEWSIEPGISLLGSKELLAQIAANLLDNARIHTPAGTVIALTLAAEGPQARLSVRDDGPGVDAEDRAKLLQRFFRTDASRTTPGNGLGLSLVAASARAHGGNVTVEDANPGLLIVVSLPMLMPDVEKTVGPAERTSSLLSVFRRDQWPI